MKAKLIWNFNGQEALKTAEHHLIHLKEYCQRENVEALEYGTEKQNDFSALSFMIVDKDLAASLRVSLKPHQGFLVDSIKQSFSFVFLHHVFGYSHFSYCY